MWIKVGYHANTCAAPQFVYEHQGLSKRYSNRIITNFESVVRSCENYCSQIYTHCREAGSTLQYEFAHNVCGVRPLSLTCCGGTRHENAKCESVDCEGGIHFQHADSPKHTIVVAKCHMLFVRVWANGYGVLKSVFGATYALTNLWLCARSGPTNSYLGRVGD